MLADKDRLDEADIAWMRGLPGFWSLSLGEAAGDSCSAPAWPHCNTHQHASCLGVLISEYGVLVVNKQKNYANRHLFIPGHTHIQERLGCMKPQRLL